MNCMEVHSLAGAVVDRIQEIQDRMRSPMIWQVTDVLLKYERLIAEARAALREADMALLAAGIKRDDPTRKRLGRILEEFR